MIAINTNGHMYGGSSVAACVQNPETGAIRRTKHCIRRHSRYAKYNLILVRYPLADQRDDHADSAALKADTTCWKLYGKVAAILGASLCRAAGAGDRGGQGVPRYLTIAKRFDG